MRDLLLSELWACLLGPVLFWPLIQDDIAPADVTAQRVARGVVGPLCSLYCLERLLHAVTDPDLLDTTCLALLGGGGGGASGELSAEVLGRLQYSSTAYRQALLDMLRGGDAQLAAGAVRVLCALLRSRAVREGTLCAVGLLPRRIQRQRALLASLTDDSAAAAAGALRGGCSPAASQLAGGASGSGGGGGASPRAATLRLWAADGGNSVGVHIAVQGSGEDEPLEVPCSRQQGATGSGKYPDLTPTASQQHPQSGAAAPPMANGFGQPAWLGLHGPEAGSPSGPQAVEPAGDSRFGAVVSALLGLLGCEAIPPLALRSVSWLLLQLVGGGKAGELLDPRPLRWLRRGGIQEPEGVARSRCGTAVLVAAA